MPNPQEHSPATPVVLQRVDTAGNAGLPIEPDLPTWVVVHGRVGDPSQFRPLAGKLSRLAASDQVLVLDWSGAAADNTDQVGLNGAEWISYVSDWATAVLTNMGVSGAETVLVGHSWGSYVAFATAQRLGGVQGLVALDPAQAGIGYPFHSIDFNTVSRQSWAFYGAGLWGSPTLAPTASAAFFVEYGNVAPSAYDRHHAPIHVFERLVDDNLRGDGLMAQLFPMWTLMAPPANPPWQANAYSSDGYGLLPGFEGAFSVVGQPDAFRTYGTFWRLSTLRYFDVNLGREAVVAEENSLVVAKLYQQVLHRAPETTGLAYWTDQLTAGAPPSAIAEGIFESNERLDPILAQYYRDFLLREADPAGLAFWRDRVWKRDGGPENVVAGMIGSHEFFSSAGGTNQDWVTELYQRLLQRAPDQLGIQHWTTVLDSRRLDRGGAVLGFVRSDENFRNLVAGWFQQYLKRNPMSAETDDFAGLMRNGASHRGIQLLLINSQEYRNSV